MLIENFTSFFAFSTKDESYNEKNIKANLKILDEPTF